MSILINIAVRIAIFYFLAEVLLFPDDPRFAGKAIPIRNFIIVITLSLLFPVLYYLNKKGKIRLSNFSKYPFALDSLYLSIFALDMFGNSFNLYDTIFYFDLIPHFHGPGALAVVLLSALAISPLTALGLTTTIHTFLEAQEYYTDVLFQTHNVRGVFDVVNDLVAGIFGAAIYMLVFFVYKRFNKK